MSLSLLLYRLQSAANFPTHVWLAGFLGQFRRKLNADFSGVTVKERLIRFLWKVSASRQLWEQSFIPCTVLMRDFQQTLAPTMVWGKRWEDYRKTDRVLQFVRLFSSEPSTNPHVTHAKLVSTEIQQIWTKCREGLTATPHRKKHIISHALTSFKLVLDRHRNRLTRQHIALMFHRIGNIIQNSGLNVWMCGKHNDLFSELLVLSYAKGPTFRPREVASIMWGMGRIGTCLKSVKVPLMEFKMLMQRLVAPCVGKVGLLDGGSAAMMLQGFANLKDRESRELVFLIAKHFRSRLEELDNNAFCIFVWSLAQLRYVDLCDLLPSVVASAKNRLDMLDPVHISNIIWGLAIMGHFDCIELLNKAVERLRVYRGSIPISAQSVCNVVWGMQQSAMVPPEASITRIVRRVGTSVDAVDASMALDLTQFSPQEVVTTLYAFQEFNFRTKPMMAFILESKEYFWRNKARFSVRDVMNYGWALMMLDQLNEPILSEMIRYGMNMDVSSAHPINYRQLYQCMVHFRVLYPEIEIKQRVPSQTEEFWRMLWVRRQATSPLPLWMSLALKKFEEIGFVTKGREMVGNVVNTCLLEDKGGRDRYAIEGVNVSRQIQSQTCQQPISRYLWKLRILRALGYEVIEIDELQWEQLRGKENIERYLKDVFNEAKMRQILKYK